MNLSKDLSNLISLIAIYGDMSIILLSSVVTISAFNLKNNSTLAISTSFISLSSSDVLIRFFKLILNTNSQISALTCQTNIFEYISAFTIIANGTSVSVRKSSKSVSTQPDS